VIRISGGSTVEVWRVPDRDRHGDGTPVKVGEIDHVVLQWGTTTGLEFEPSNGFEETATLSTVMFVPKTGIRVRQRDRLKLIRGLPEPIPFVAGHHVTTYQVVGGRAWDMHHPMTGYDFGYYMVAVEAVT
jgi:hypothetical protein